MPDDTDFSQETQQHDLELLIKTRPRGQEVAFTGSCRFCGDPVEFPRRWCSTDCRNDWEKYDGKK